MSKYKITPELLGKVKELYPDAEVFPSQDSDFICIRRTHNKSKFYKVIGWETKKKSMEK